MNKRLLLTIVAVGGVVALAACSKHSAPANKTPGPTTAQKAALAATVPLGATTSTPAAIAATATLPHLAYVAQLKPLNSSVTGMQTTGRAQFAVSNGKLAIRVSVTGAPPGITHWQHIHGFVSGKNAQCATKKNDTNHDSVVDLIETKAVSGKTLVPLNGNPAAMQVSGGGYPVASANGSYIYQVIVPMAKLQSAFGKKFKGQKLDLAKRVVYVHGVPKATKLPASVSTLPGAPAYVTLPIACGKITAVSPGTSPSAQSAPSPSS